VFFLAQACMDIVLLKKGWFDGKIDSDASEFGPEHGLATLEDTIIVLKFVLISLFRKIVEVVLTICCDM
jgi:hypothetical protein